ncbi:hypothetical protein H2198_003968 [Neophaeococcomyces mojaviensis]|uniref:Uncharacterized protein n=1 Tax=Neophaeococcomyces mojaviensis TaxID=3383035 RepID=A0ACC3A9W9_9EURO|nr:hypothetical protein H2198_003968 [Knufia sp. JES_112]
MRNQAIAATKIWLLLWIPILMLLPAQLAAPLASGAIKWIPSSATFKVPQPVELGKAGNGEGWEDFNNYHTHRLFAVTRSAGLAYFHSNYLFDSERATVLRSYIPQLQGYSVNETFLNSATLPHLAIESFEWISDFTTITSSESRTISSVLLEKSPNLNISQQYNPFQHPSETFVTSTVLALNEPWQKASRNNDSNSNSSEYQYPQPQVLHKSLLLGVFVARNDLDAILTDCHDPSKYFGPIPSGIELYDTYNRNNVLEHCYAFARISFSAGVIQCMNCLMVDDGVVEADLTRQEYRDLKLLADPMVSTAVQMIPEALSYITWMNSTFMPTWQNLDGYAKGIVSLAYQTNWNALQLRLTSPGSTYLANITTSYPVLVAQVNMDRIWVWLALNLLVLPSGALLFAMQTKCRSNVVMQPVIHALMVNSDAVARSENSGSSAYDWRLGKITKEGKERRIRMALAERYRNSSRTQRYISLVFDEDQELPSGTPGLATAPGPNMPTPDREMLLTSLSSSSTTPIYAGTQSPYEENMLPLTAPLNSRPLLASRQGHRYQFSDSDLYLMPQSFTPPTE